jgi:hypothetical protein
MEAPFFAHSLGLFSFSFVNIDDLPLLVFASVVAPNSYSLAFNVFSTSNIKDLVVSWVDKLSSFVFEQLEPSRIGTPDLHVVGSTSTLDIPRLVVVSGSDGLGLLVEVPDLGPSSVGSLDDHVSVVDQVKVFSTWEC